MAKIRFSIALPPQDREWKDYLAAVQAADRMAFETFWSWDHLMPIFGDMEGPNFECYTTLSALAQATTRIRIGALVSGVAYRNAAMQIKMATQVDIISGGRFDFGIGAGWAEREFQAFDIYFGSPAERIRMMREMLDLAKLLWSGDPRKKVTYAGKIVQATDLFLNPQPVQRPHPPIMIGGGGEQLTLKVVARHADIWHAFGDLATLKRKIGLIDEYAKAYGRDGREIVKSTGVPIWVGSQPSGQGRRGVMAGSPAEIEKQLQPYIDAGITYFIVNGPLDLENWQRISDQIIPRYA